jgi:hypothetical protein
MVVISCEVKYKGAVPRNADIGRRLWVQILQKAWSEVGFYFFDKFVHRHFEQGASQRYEYKKRAGEESGLSYKAFTRTYTGRKQKKFHHMQSMVWSGRTREGAKRATIYPLPRGEGVRIALPGIVHVNQYKPQRKKHGDSGPPIDLREEILAITREEAEEAGKIHEAVVTRLFKEHTGQEIVNI